MERYLCGTVVIARDEENRIEACLESLRNQSVTMYVVLVNDGIIDGTKRIASQYGNLVVDLPRHDESWTEKPELANVFNAGFEALEKMNIEFVLISARAEFENFMNAPKKQHEDFKTDIWIRIGRVLLRARNE